MRNNSKKGFSLIELMVVLAVLSFLLAIAVPSYLGIRDSVRLKAAIASARAAMPELQAWMQLKISQPDLRQADTNCDGTIDTNDLTNGELFNAGVANTYALCRNNFHNDKSPWSSSLPLWSTDPSIPPGQITLIEEQFKLTIIAKNIQGGIIFRERIEI